MNILKSRIELLQQHPLYPFLSWNNDINQYVLANYFWINVLKEISHFKDWTYYDSYINFDTDHEVSNPAIKLYNYYEKKILTIFHMGNYEEEFDYPYFLVGAGNTALETENGEDNFIELSLMVDLRHSKSLDSAIGFISQFLDDKIQLEQLDQIINEFELKYENDFSRLNSI